MNILLVGEDPAALRGMALDLALQGAKVTVANDAENLAAALSVSTPDVIIFDHIEPLDVYVLNPRTPGYQGPLVLLVERDVPDEFEALLRPHHVARKPLVVERLYLEIRRIATGSQAGSQP